LRGRGGEKRLEEEGEPDRWGPPVGERREGKSWWAAGPRNSWAARGGKQARSGTRLKGKERVWGEIGGWRGFSSFFSNLFQNLFKLQILFKIFKQTLKLLKLHTSNIIHALRNMMHKHLLLLELFKSDI
jgi:hypothetical protein